MPKNQRLQDPEPESRHTVRCQLTKENYFMFKSQLSDTLCRFGDAGKEIAEDKPFTPKEPLRSEKVVEEVILANGQVAQRTRNWADKDEAPFAARYREFLDRKKDYERQRGLLWSFLTSQLSAEVWMMIRNSGTKYKECQKTNDTLGLWRHIVETVFHKSQDGVLRIAEIKANWAALRQYDERERVYTSLQTHLYRFDSFITELTEAGEKIEDKDKIITLIRSLKKGRYAQVVLPIFTNGVGNRKYEVVKTNLLDLENSGQLDDLNPPDEEDNDPSIALVAQVDDNGGIRKRSLTHVTKGYRKGGAKSVKKSGPLDGKKMLYGSANKSSFSGKHGKTTERKNVITCFNCGENGHKSVNCRQPQADCAFCKKSGHLERFCFSKKHAATTAMKADKNPKNQSALAAKMAEISMECDDSDEEDFCAFMIKAEEDSEEDDTIIVDTGASVSIFRSRELVADFALPDHDSPRLVHISGISGNTGLQVTETGRILGLGRYVVVPNASSNLLSVHQCSKAGKYRFVFAEKLVIESLNSDLDNLEVEARNGVFKLTGNQMRSLLQQHQLGLIANAEADRLDLAVNPLPKFSAEQIKRARKVRELHIYLSHPSTEYLIMALRSGSIVGTALTPMDVRNETLLHGPCPNCLAGKITRPNYRASEATPPAQMVGEKIHCDLLPLPSETIGGSRCLFVAIDEFSGFIILLSIKSNKSHTSLLSDGFEKVIGLMKSRGHTVKVFQTDSESVLLACENSLALKHGIQLKAVPPYQHAQRVERYIRTLKDKGRAVLDGLPYNLPPSLVAELFSSVATSMNDIPNSTHPTESPRSIVLGEKMDLGQRQLVPFGALAMFHTPGKERTNVAGEKLILPPRSDLGVVLGPAPESTYKAVRAYLFYKSGVRTRHHFTVLSTLPMDFEFQPKTQQNATTDFIVRNMFTRFERFSAAEELAEEHRQRRRQPVQQQQEGVQQRSFRDQTETIADLPLTQPILHMEQESERVEEHGPVSADERPEIQENAPEVEEQEIYARTEVPQVMPVMFPSATTTSDEEGFSSPSFLPEADSTGQSSSERMVLTRMTGSKRKAKGTSSVTENAVRSTTKSRRTLHKSSASSTAVSLSRPRLATSRAGRVIRRNSIYAMAVQEMERALRISVKDALAGPRAVDSRRAIVEEVQNMLEYQVGTYVTWSEVSDVRNVIPAFMFLKYKTFPDGTYDRTKARLVANGRRQGYHLYEAVSSATVYIPSLFLVLNIITYRRMRMRTYDVKGAFLQARISPEATPMYLLISEDVADIWCLVDPAASQFRNKKGQLLLRLNRFLYGLKQSPLEFQRLLHRVLKTAGFIQCSHDECVFVRRVTVDGTLRMAIAAVHVDDILIAADTDELLEEFDRVLRNAFPEITKNDPVHSHLGMSVHQSEDRSKITLNQKGMVESLLEKSLPPGLKPASTPAAADLFVIPSNDSEIPPEESADDRALREEYLSVVMSLMYLGRLTRPDIILPVTVLAARAHQPSTHDIYHLRRILRYLRGTINQKLMIECTRLELECHCDSGYGSHHDGRSHSGYILAFPGSGNVLSLVLSRSFKQRVTAVSSTDAEIIAAVEAVQSIVWLNGLLRELVPDQEQNPVRMTQDNRSAIVLSTQTSRMRRSKHILTKLGYIKDHIVDNLVVMEPVPTEQMVADFNTKPLNGHLFRIHKARICGEASD